MARGLSQRTGADHNLMRGVNRSLVLDILKASSPISRASIAQIASLAKPTVSGIVDELIREGLVREIGLGAAARGGGRPPILLEFNVRSQFVAGVHIGVRTTTIVISDASGTEIARRQSPTPRVKPIQALQALAAEIKTALEAGMAPMSRLVAVGVVLPGLTDYHDGVCILAPNLGWRDVPVRDVLTKALGVPVFVHHTGQASAVAEYVEGAGKGVDHLALLYVGSGIGAGILTEGRVFHGAGGLAGEIGHCQIPGGTELCSCGKVGCLETVAAAPALVRYVERGLAAGKPSSLPKRRRGITPREIGIAAADGDRLALAAVTEIGKNAGLAASWLINVFNPEVLVIAGGLADLGEPFLAPLRQAVNELTLAPALERVDVRNSQLGQDAEVRGAVLLALQHSETFLRVVFQR